uniref:Uncharacterized protein n=1 Tax=Globodera rostochiensis TaxID=31243 RepID=A0A914GU95_GLORO
MDQSWKLEVGLQRVESNEEQFDGRWQDESALKGNVKVEHEPHYGAVKVEEKDKIKHEFEWWDEESGEFKEQLEDNVKEEDQDGQAPNTSDHKKIGDNSNKHLSDQNNSTDQDENVDEQQNEFNESPKLKRFHTQFGICRLNGRNLLITATTLDQLTQPYQYG